MDQPLSRPGLLGMLLVLVVASAWPACRRQDPSAAPTTGTTPNSAVAVLSPDKVRGSWHRTDGDYRLVIGKIDEGGHAWGEYHNPNPIKVAWTRVRLENAAIKVDLELRDTNYPGCLYKLTYDPASDRLVGTYFQALQQQTYAVEFVRAP